MFKLVLISLATFLFLINAASQPKTFKLQFVTGSDSLVIWNDRHEDKFASHLFNIYSRKEKILPQKMVCIDCPTEGSGRQLVLMNIHHVK